MLWFNESFGVIFQHCDSMQILRPLSSDCVRPAAAHVSWLKIHCRRFLPPFLKQLLHYYGCYLSFSVWTFPFAKGSKLVIMAGWKKEALEKKIFCARRARALAYSLFPGGWLRKVQLYKKVCLPHEYSLKIWTKRCCNDGFHCLVKNFIAMLLRQRFYILRHTHTTVRRRGWIL